MLRRPLAAALALLAGATTVVLTGGAASAYPGAPWFEPGKPYNQNFADPHVMRVGSDYYAYATGTGGSYLPVMHSRDQQTWIAREAYRSGPASNDGLLAPARWAYHGFKDTHMTTWVTAPGVAQFGNTFNAYYGLWHNTNPDRHCISVATSSSPKGPFTDNTTAPLVCDGRSPGSFDPSPFVDPATGAKYLLWTSEGPGTGINPPLKLWARQLNDTGLAWAAGSSPREVLRETGGWEFPVVENPSMVRHNGRLYLFYSGNNWWTDKYAVGYAVCDSPLGPCHKRGQIMTSNGLRQGPGGASAFTEADGRLKLAYHYWTAPYVGYPTDPNCDGGGKCTSQGQRRMAIAEVSDLGDGRLRIGGSPPSASSATAGTSWVGARAGNGSVSVRSVGADGRTVETIPLGGGAIGAPAVAAGPNGALAVAIRGLDNAVWVRQRTSASAGWSGWTSIGGTVTAQPAMASWGAGRLDVVARGADGAMWQRAQSGGTWLSWASLGGGFAPGTGPALSSPGSQSLMLAAVGLDRQVWARTHTPSGWTGWQRVGGSVIGDVAVSSPQPGRSLIVGRGLEDQAYVNLVDMTASGVRPYGWAPQGGVLSASPAIASAPGSGRTDLFVLGLDGRIWRKTQTSMTSGWSGWSPV